MHKTLISFVLFLSCGCSILPARVPQPALHDFGPVNTTKASGTFSMLSVGAPDWLSGDRIFYRLAYVDPTQLLSYNQDHWLAPPAALIQQYLSLESKEATHLRLTLLNFEQIFAEPGAAHVYIRIRLVSKSDGAVRPLRERDFHFTQPCATPDAIGAVAAFAQLIPRLQQEIQNWLIES